MEEQKAPTIQQIEQRAYEIYLERGGEDGRSIEDWIAAEQELKEQLKRNTPAPSKARAARA